MSGNLNIHEFCTDASWHDLNDLNDCIGLAYERRIILYFWIRLYGMAPFLVTLWLFLCVAIETYNTLW